MHTECASRDMRASSHGAEQLLVRLGWTAREEMRQPRHESSPPARASAVIQDQTAKLRRVYVRAPRPDDLVAWESYGWRERPDPARAKEDHTKLRAELEKAGVEILLSGSHDRGGADLGGD